MIYKIADIITEYTPQYENLRRFSAPFRYTGERPVQIKLAVSEEQMERTMERMTNPSKEKVENFLYSCAYNRAVIRYHAMLIHSSGIICNGGAYLFAAVSGMGKSTHTRLWLQEFGDEVHIFNDDKPVVRADAHGVTAYGTPFDGGSGIAHNESAPLKAIVFLERGEQNDVRVPSSKEIIQRLYFQTAHKVGAQTAEAMLGNFDRLIKSSVPFYVLTCNMLPEAAHVARNAIVKS